MRQQHLSQQQGQPGSAPLASRRRRRQRYLAITRGVLRGLVLALLAVAALFSLLAGLLVWLIAARAHDRREAWRWVVLLAVIGAGAYAAWFWQGGPLPWLWHTIMLDLAHHLWQAALAPVIQLWAVNALFSPLTALLLAALFRRSKQPATLPILKEMSIQEYEEAARAEQATATQALATFEHMVAQEPQPQEPGALLAIPPLPTLRPAPRLEVLGNYEGGELMDWVYAGKFCLSSNLLRVHGVLVGEPSFGKTTTLIRLLAIARVLGRKVVYLDLKGSQKTAAHFLAAMAMLGTLRVRMYPWQALDGWRGGSQALFNRLMEQIDPKTHPFYRAGVGATVVSLAVNAPPGPPKNSYEFLERLEIRWLKRAYATDAQAQRELRAVADHINGLALVFSGFFRGIHGALDGTWSFEDADAAYIGVDGTANKEEAATLARYIVEDAAHYATSRKDPSDQVFFVIDEFGVMRSTNATDLYERVRESGMSIYAAVQSYESLGQERNNLLAAAAVKILHRAGAPEPLVKFAGERETPQYSRYVGGAGGSEAELLPATNQPDAGNRPDTIMRTQKEYSITVEEVQQLTLGRVAFLYGGEGAFVQVTPLDLPGTLVEVAWRFLEAMPRYTPLPVPRREPLPERERNREWSRKSERRPQQPRAGRSGMGTGESEVVTGPSPDLAPRRVGGQGEVAAIDDFNS